jgi:amino acid transporter
MIGAGIFSLMGQAGAIAGKAVYISFILGGLVAAISGYSLAKLGARYPAAGGILDIWSSLSL